MTIRKLAAWIAAAILTALGAWYLLAPKPILVEVDVVRKGKFVATIVEDGRARVRNRFTISSPLAGRISRISLRPGDSVRAGQTIAVIHPTLSPLIDLRTRQELEARMGAAEAAVAEAKANNERLIVLRDKTRITLERTQQLRLRGVVAASTLEDATFAFNAAERDVLAAAMRLDAAEHSFDAAKAALKRTLSGPAPAADIFQVTAPVDAKVLRILQESEATVGAGAVLLELGHPGDMEIVVDLLTTDAVRVNPGASVTITNWGGTADLKGRVRRVEPSAFTKVSALGVEEQRVWVVIDMVSPDKLWARLEDGFRVETNIVANEIVDARLIPVGALFRRSDSWFVFALDSGVARLRKVEIRERSGRIAAIASGLEEGQIVVLFPPTALKDGSPVTLVGR